MRLGGGIAILFLAVSMLAGCASTPRFAPVVERTPEARKLHRQAVKSNEPDWRPQFHAVQKGDTLYAISLEYGFDYRELAEWNGIEPPYVIRIGQQLRLSPSPQNGGAATVPLKTVAPVIESSQGEEAAPQPLSAVPVKTLPKAGKVPYTPEAESAPRVAAPAVSPPVEEKPVVLDARAAPPSAEDRKTAPLATPASDEDPDWAWPAKGRLLATFGEAGNSKGVDIAGKAGQPVFAAAPGKVVYSGSGLRGYGKLVIIKHNKTYLSAYAHNSQILVKEGQGVQKGQRIAEMGDSDADQVKLHFEIRRLGKPVDPLKYLPEG